MKQPSFIHLRVHSVYSLLEGANHVKNLVKWAHKQKMPAIAITDHGNLFGALEFCTAAVKEGVQPIVGSVLYVRPEQGGGSNARNQSAVEPDQILLYAQTAAGWQNLIKLVSMAYLEPAEGGHAPLISYDNIKAHSEGLIALTGGVYGSVGRAILEQRTAAAEQSLLFLKAIFDDRLYMELSRHGLPEEAACEPTFIALAHTHNIPLVATNDVYFPEAEMYEAHDAFICIAEGRYVGEDDRRHLTPEHRLKTADEMVTLFADIPEALSNSVQIAKRCSYMSRPHDPILPNFTQDGTSESDELRKQAREGLRYRLEKYVFEEDMDEAKREEVAKPYHERLEFELDVIIKMQFPGYFLIVSDFIKWSKAQNIPVGPGRGSGAGSLVAWSMMITDLNPLRYGLLFERFLNPERVSMPDFDVDFCQERREEVIRYVQQHYGKDRVAQIITFGTLQARAALRDVGRVLQMSYGQVDRICKLVPANPANPVSLTEALDVEPMLKQSMQEDESTDKLVNMSIKLEGLYRHASTHAAGVVIGDRPLDELVPLYRDPKSDMPVVQYSMKYAEMAGLVKFDFLGLKTLTVLSRACKLLAPRNVTIDLLDLPEGDRVTYDLLSRGDTVGVFQLESAGMRDTLKKLKPDTMEDIIALVSLYRPGPMDNIPTYIARKHGKEKPKYLHPLLEEVLKETFGVIIYQEQVMQIAQRLAGYSLGEADLLRRAMGKKIRSEMEAQRGIFVEKSVARGVEGDVATEIFNLVAKFAEYGFNKSHAAAYALIAYQTGYLKANYPVEFIAASMTYDMHNTEKLGIFREDAMRMDVEILPPDVNHSDVLFSVEDGAIRYALAAIRNVGGQAMELVVAERKENGPYNDIFDFLTRVPMEGLNRRAIEFLIKAGAFDTIAPNRALLFDNIELLLSFADTVHKEKASNQVSLFGGADGEEIQKPALKPAEEWPSLKQLENEFSAIGFYLSAHPLEGYKNALAGLRVISSSAFADKLGTKYKSIKIAGIVTGRKFKSSSKGRFAFLQLSDMGGLYEVSIFDEALLNNQRDLLENGNILLIKADAKMDDSGIRLIAQSLSLFDDAMSNNTTVLDKLSYHIDISRIEAVERLHALLKGVNNGRGAKISLQTLHNNNCVGIDLPGRFQVSPSLLDHIKAIDGIDGIDERAA